MKKAIIAFGAIALVFMISQCTSKTNQADQLDEQKMEQGFNLVTNTCFTCHNPEATMDNRIAPPMFAVKNHYNGMEEEAFVNAVVSFLEEPKEEKTMMPGALKKFGLMPPLSLSKEELNAVAYYLYHTELERPGWYADHFKAEQKRYFRPNSAADRSDIQIGKEAVLSTKSVLGKNLLNAINTHGAAGAVDFCNTRAIPLTDSMQQDLGMSIKRVSDQNRNPENVANSQEREYIIRTKEVMREGGKPQPKVFDIDGQKVAYYPIVTNDMCLKCHGKKGEDIDPETLKRIETLYPEDHATGYEANQLRGIWVVQWEAKQ